MKRRGACEGSPQNLVYPAVWKGACQQGEADFARPNGGKIWEAEGFPIRGKGKSKWLAYAMAMRARVFDDWTEEMLCANPEALVLQIGCGLDSRCLRVKAPYLHWIDTDFPEVLSLRKKYYEEDEAYRMMALDASKPEQLETLPDGESAVLLLEGVSMYLTNEQVRRLLQALGKKYARLQILMDVYTALGARASKYKNPVKDVGVAEVYGIEEIRSLLKDTKIGCRAEHSLTPDVLVNALKPLERAFFRAVFAERLYRKFYRLYELERAA